MSTVRVLVLRTAGINCEEEVMHCWETAGGSPTLLPLDDLLSSPATLDSFDIVTLPGGFSYGDDLGAGVIFAERMSRELAGPLQSFVAGGGGILGICNGFQILVKAGLLPGGTVGPGSVTVTHNDSNRFEARWVRLRCVSETCPFLRPGEVLELPVEHAEGKVIARDRATVAALCACGHIALRYEGEEGDVKRFPANPNGSVDGIAGLCDATGRVLGMMPHPDRHFALSHHPSWTSRVLRGETVGEHEPDGLRVFSNAVAFWSMRG